MARLGDVIEQIRGVSYKPSDLKDTLNDNSVILLRANNIQDGKIVLDDVLYVSKSKVNESQYLRRGDILVCTSSGSKELVGKAAFVDENLPAVFGAFCKVVRPKIECCKYVGHFFQSPYYRNYISAASAGANINNLRNEHIADLHIPLPPLEEQRKIAAVLDKVSDLIAKRRTQLDKLDELVKSRFIEMFGDPEKNPKRWQEDKLNNHLEVMGGYAFKSDQFTDEGIPVLRIGNINSGRFLPVNMVYWPEDLTLTRYKVFPGDLVMSLTGTVGKDDYANVCILGSDYNEYYLNQRNAKLSIGETFNKYYFSELLKFSQIKKRLTGISRGVRQANISNNDILTLCVPVPPIELQNQFADFVKQTDKSKLAIQKNLEKLEILKKSLMQKYFD